MCGRYSLATPDPGQIRARFGLAEAVPVRQRFNVAPGDEVLAVTTDKGGAPRGELLHWGPVPSWARGPELGLKLINARAETVAEKPAFRQAFERWRCLIPADGFYEWQARAGAPKQPFHITRDDGRPFAFAGLWSLWRAGTGEAIRSCTIITAPANAAIAPLHDRMPAILDPAVEAAWLDAATPPAQLREMLGGLSAPEIALRPVSAAVNDARYDGPECLAEPLPEPQGALF